MLTDQFHFDSCGFGLIANLDRIYSRSIIDKAIEGLKRLSHRGTKAKDAKSADGCGILFNLDKDFFKKLIKEESDKEINFLGVAVVFLNENCLLANFEKIFNTELKLRGFKLVHTRSVPVNSEFLGLRAAKTLPQILQFYIDSTDTHRDINTNENDIVKKLYLAKRLTEARINCHFASLSTQLISYKGMLTPENLVNFYPDLNHKELKASHSLFHQRFSTNTFPEWHLVQPFNHLAHNGEINTIEGNRNWAQAKRKMYYLDSLKELQALKSLIDLEGSDSKSLNSMLELLLAGGFDLAMAMKILIPPAFIHNPTLEENLKAMYEYFSLFIEPWDGPAAIACINESFAVCNIDRNGLRPARYIITKDNEFSIASEIGVVDYDEKDILTKGKLGAGESLGINLLTGEILFDKDISKKITEEYKFTELSKSSIEKISEDFNLADENSEFNLKDLKTFYKYNQITLEELNLVYSSLTVNAQEALSSMGDDSCTAILSKHKRNLFDYFRQRFAQVTNPPIDSIREKNVMSLNTYIGAIGNIFTDFKDGQKRLKLSSPILSQTKLNNILSHYAEDSIQEVNLNISSDKDIKSALLEIKESVIKNLAENRNLIILSDRKLFPKSYKLHPLLVTAFINYFLINLELRAKANLIVITGEAKDPHHFACLIAFGATLVYPYLSFQAIQQIYIDKTKEEKEALCLNYIKGIENGILKILSKMGISTVSSYRGSGLFDILGLNQDVLDFCFNGKESVCGGLSLLEYEKELRELALEANNETKEINCGGLIKYHPEAEEHGFTPEIVLKLQDAVKSDDYQKFKEYSALVDQREYLCFRDLFKLSSSRKAIPIDEVESRENIIKRFSISAMSLGAISPEAHEALALAMNKLGSRSNSGEGGEDIKRSLQNSHSKIKQVASGRFGVNAEYLADAEVIQIKIAQGAKPGEGGQLPGYKVNALIAKLRHAKEGTTLISPPPHHDIYSIEDLAQLIYDLKEMNSSAEISVKLVSSLGVATVALGVAKAKADAITIAGADGGTGASPLSSIRYAGFPWEIGLLLTHKLLIESDYRNDIKLQIDGGLKTGLDVIKGALMGANEFGFGTSSLISLGCKYLRICHLNNCATGVATQNETLRKEYFRGLTEYVISFMNFIAEEVREHLAALGYRSLNEIIGRQEILKLKEPKTIKQAMLDFSKLFLNSDQLSYSEPLETSIHLNDGNDFNQMLLEEYKNHNRSVLNVIGVPLHVHEVTNSCRSIGSSLSAYIVKQRTANPELIKPRRIKLKGIAGQSFGAFLVEELCLELEGAANDYVAKGLSGGTIILKSSKARGFIARNSIIMGNTCLYGATSGKLFAEGGAGERFAIRNSGAIAVIESAGDYACEYMTGGTVLILGSCGIEIGAGMTGGIIFIYDPEKKLKERINISSVRYTYLKDLEDKELKDTSSLRLKELIGEHFLHTNSSWAQHIIDNYTEMEKDFAIVYSIDSKIEDLIKNESLSLSRL